MTRLAFPLQIQLVNREDLFAFQLLGSHGWVILVSAASWSLLHLVLWVLISVFRSLRPVYLKEASLGECIRSSKFAELRSEIIGAVHAAVIAVCCFYLLFAGASELHVEPTWGWDQASVAVIGTAVGYLLYDLVYLFWCYEPGFEQFLLHHIVVILLYSYCALRPYIHHEALIFLTWEASTPFLNLRKILMAYGYTDTLLFSVNQVTFALTFFVVRILGGWYTSFQFLSKYAFNTPPELRKPVMARYMYTVANVILNALNLFWFTKICSRVLKIITGTETASSQQSRKGKTKTSRKPTRKEKNN